MALNNRPPPTASAAAEAQSIALPGSEAWSTVAPMSPSPRPRTNGAMNTLLSADGPAHDWYRFVLSFPPHLVRDYIQRFDLGPSSGLLDPFCGTGTTLVEAKKSGIPSWGIEAVPMSRHAAGTKVNWTPEPNRLARHAGLVAEEAIARLAADGITDEPMAGVPADMRLKSLPAESSKLLLKNSIRARANRRRQMPLTRANAGEAAPICARSKPSAPPQDARVARSARRPWRQGTGRPRTTRSGPHFADGGRQSPFRPGGGRWDHQTGRTRHRAMAGPSALHVRRPISTQAPTRHIGVSPRWRRPFYRAPSRAQQHRRSHHIAPISK